MTITSTTAAATLPPTRDNNHAPAPWQAGLAMGGLGAIASFAPGLLPRSRVDQVIATSATAGGAFLAGIGVDAVANQLDRHTGLDALGSRVALAGAGAAAFLGVTLATRGKPSPAWSAVRSAAIVTTFGAAIGAGLILERDAAERLDGVLPGGRAVAHATIFGAAALGSAYVLLHRPRASARGLAPQPTGPVQGQTKLAAGFDQAAYEQLQALRSNVTTVSGGPGSLLPREGLNKHGVRFTAEVTPAREIERVMGTTGAKDPVRIYAGLPHGDSPRAIAEAAYQEAVRLKAFDRRMVVLYLPSGTGYVNPIPVQANEFMANGDVASVAVQYGTKPSIVSLHRIPRASQTYDVLVQKFADHIAQLPEGRRPLLAAYGESLGAIGAQNVFRGGGTEGVAARGVDRVLWVGTPRISGFHRELFPAGGHSLDATGRAVEFNGVDDLLKYPAEQRDKLRLFFLSHYNDPVARFEPSLFWRRPEWLSEPGYALGIPRNTRWMPGATGVLTAVDVKNGTKVLPGYFEATGHDYRADLAPVVAQAFGHNPSAEQVGRVTKQLIQAELARVKFPVVVPGA